MGSDPIEEAASAEAVKLAGEIKGNHLGSAIHEINEWRQEVGSTCFQATLADLNWELHNANVLPNLDVVDAAGNKLVVQEHDGDRKFTLGPDGKLAPVEPPRPPADHAQDGAGATPLAGSQRHDFLKGVASVSAEKEASPYESAADISSNRAYIQSSVRSTARAVDQARDLKGHGSFTSQDHSINLEVSLLLKAGSPDGPVNVTCPGKVTFANRTQTHASSYLEGAVVTENGRRYYEGSVSNPYLGKVPYTRIELR